MASGHGHILPTLGIDLTSYDDFRDDGACVEGEITRATNDGFHVCAAIPPYCVDPRWHARCAEHTLSSPYGYWASCTPHWDWPACGKHEVPPVYNGDENYTGSGFDAARDWLWYQLVHQYGMTFVGPVNFSNRSGRVQCNGDITRADGKVNVIQLR
jgi:hypothetical protein